jgi:hypothetical protein
VQPLVEDFSDQPHTPFWCGPLILMQEHPAGQADAL